MVIGWTFWLKAKNLETLFCFSFAKNMSISFGPIIGTENHEWPGPPISVAFWFRDFSPKISGKSRGWWNITLQGTNISPYQGTFEDDFAFPQVGYVNSLEGIQFGRIPGYPESNYTVVMASHSTPNFGGMAIAPHPSFSGVSNGTWKIRYGSLRTKEIPIISLRIQCSFWAPF